jgi:hypothetical protein
MAQNSTAGDHDLVRLFQYGSNMHHGHFIERIEKHYDKHAPPGTPIEVKCLGPAMLDGWRLQANLWGTDRECRVVNIVKESGEVWGALYELAADLVTRSDGERSLVDRLEGHRTTVAPENYAKICVTVDLRGEPRTAWTYIGLREAINRCEREHPGTTCDPSYADAVIAGAESIEVPDSYLAVLREAVST